jgi:hypothetical protein
LARDLGGKFRIVGSLAGSNPRYAEGADQEGPKRKGPGKQEDIQREGFNGSELRRRNPVEVMVIRRTMNGVVFSEAAAVKQRELQ